MMRNLTLIFVIGGLSLSLTSLQSHAQPDDMAAFLGTYQLKGRYSNWRKTKADLSILEEAGKVTLTRTGKYTTRRHRKKPPFTWVSTDARIDGDRLRATFRITTEGKSLRLADGGSLVDALDGNAAVDEHGNAVSAGDINVLEAEYRFDGDTFRETIRNRTRKKPEHWWRRVGTKGTKLSSPQPDTTVQRIKLGEELEAKDGRYTVVIPTDGTLSLTLTTGTIKLENPAGEVAAVTSGDTATLEVPHEDPVLGIYTAVVEGTGGAAKLKARFVQYGKIDPRIRPWSSHTYYPIYEFGWGTSANTNTMFVKDGPLEKLDKVLGLEGRQSAIWWEKGGEYRTNVDFEELGHYTRKQSPTEKAAEADWHADLNGDGVIEKEGAAGVLERMDGDSDGKISQPEAKSQFELGVVKSLWNRYDENSDDKVSSGEISTAFIGRYDADSSGDLKFEEWEAALRKDYASLLEDRSKNSLTKFMEKDADGDGFVVESELGDPGALDFQDSSDVDGDFQNFFDRNNIKITTKDGATHFGNKVEKSGGKLKLFKGRKRDELVVELDEAKVDTRENGIADGDLDDSYSVGWWGHCNAWAMASIIFRKPQAEMVTNGVTLTVRDQKGILVEYAMGDTEDSTFWWQQWDGDEIPPGKYAAGFHRQMHRWLRVEQKGMMADMDLKDPHNSLNFQVWNYPLIGYTAEMKEAEGDDPYVLDVSNTIEKGSYSDEDSSGTSTVSYRLHFAGDGAIKEGEGAKTSWEQMNSSDKREYIRYLIHPYRFVDTSRGSRNANVTLARMQKVFGEKLKYNRLEDLEDEPTPEGLSGAPSGN